MQADHQAFVEPLGACRPDIILAHHLEQAGAPHAGDIGGLAEAEHDRRADHQLQVGHGIGEQGRAGHRRPVAEPEQQGEHDQHAHPEARHRQEQDADEARQAVGDAVGPERAHDRHRDADHPRQYHRDQGDLGGQRTAPQDHVGNAFGAKERAAEIAAQDILHPGQVLHPERVAQTELRHVVGAILVAELGEAFRPEDRDQRIAGQDAHHHEDHDRDGHDRQRPEAQAPGDVAIHGAACGGVAAGRSSSVASQSRPFWPVVLGPHHRASPGAEATQDRHKAKGSLHIAFLRSLYAVPSIPETL